MNLLYEIIIIFAISIVVVFLFQKIRIPVIIGFLITGVICGPHGAGLITSLHDVEILAEMGVILLLFSIGMEFSLQSLLQIKRTVLLGGSLQVIITTTLVILIASYFEVPLNRAIVYGFMVSLSSTAIALKLLQTRSEINAPHGRTALGVLIFQDIIAVPMMLLIPLLSGEGDPSTTAVLIFAGKTAGMILFTFVGAKWLVPALFFQIAKTRSRELFILTTVVLCFGIAGLTYYLGLSLALGAFLAGLIISETEYSHEAMGNVLPFKELFTSIFFISIGMLLDYSFTINHWPVITAFVLSVLLLKTFSLSVAGIAIGLPLSISLMTGMVLSQVGEFSFILSKTAQTYSLMNNQHYQYFLSVSIITMVLTPFIAAAAQGIPGILARIPLHTFLREGYYSMTFEDLDVNFSDHVIIIGYGLNGKNVAHSAKWAGINYLVIEMNPETVRRERSNGEKIIYGDASNEAILHHGAIERARCIVITIPDAASSRRIVALSRKMNNDISIITRTRFVKEVDSLYSLGATDVISEEFETSIEIFSRVLHTYNIPENDIQHITGEIRCDGYRELRGVGHKSCSFQSEIERVSGLRVTSYRLEDASPVGGKSLLELELRKKFGASIIAIERNGKVIANPHGEEKLESMDILFMLGKKEDIDAVKAFFADVV